jgi:sulfoxide reductase heme-binding subunit YedZ
MSQVIESSQVTRTLLKWPKFTPLQVLVHLSAWSLAAWLVGDYLSGHLTINPIQAATQRLGKYALIFLTLTLANTPISNVLGYRPILKARRTMGLYSFFFAAAHFLMFAGVDYHFNFSLLLADVASKKYVWVGATALLILCALAITSTKGWMRRLGRNWKRLHRLVYAAGILVILHYAWAKKGDLFSLRGDVRQPLLFGLLILILLLLRLPAIRTWAASLRNKAK